MGTVEGLFEQQRDCGNTRVIVGTVEWLFEQ